MKNRPYANLFQLSHNPLTKLVFLFLFVLSFNQALGASQNSKRVTRFEKSQLQFLLEDSEGEIETCVHELLSHVPWWRIQCGDREYTVDVWMEHLYSKSQDLTQVTLMYHVSESVTSSGEKLVRFDSHFSHVQVSGLNSVKRLTSSMDVRNGLASLRVDVSL